MYLLNKIKRRIEYYIVTSKLYDFVVNKTPFLRMLHRTYETQTPVYLSMWFMQNIIGFNRGVYWQMHFTSQVGNWRNVYAGVETSPGYMPGCYIQSEGKIFIGDYTQIASNVGIITANHDVSDNRKHSKSKDVKIGSYCWIGMNSIILPGTNLGDFTIVGAGSVVTKSFADGYCVIAGNPAKKIKDLPKENCVKHRSKYEYNGYIPREKFEDFRRKELNV
jgi:acetyltransferase-like isoleucine patch superfamily enzyme